MIATLMRLMQTNSLCIYAGPLQLLGIRHLAYVPELCVLSQAPFIILAGEA